LDLRCIDNEVIWKRTSAHSDPQRYGNAHDTLLYYSKTDRPTWNLVCQEYDDEYIEQYYRFKDPDGRRWMLADLGAAGLTGGGYEYEWRGVKCVWRARKSTMERLDNEDRIYYTKNGIQS
jgi:hypothetical protein